MAQRNGELVDARLDGSKALPMGKVALSAEESRALLARPLVLPNGFVIPNRLAKAALSEGLGRRDLSPGTRIKRLYGRWAHSQMGLSITGNVMVDRRAIGEPGNVVVEDEKHLEDLAEWARTAKAGGSKVWVQINHPGRQSPRTLTPHPVAPSAVALPGTAGIFAEPRALSHDEIVDIIERFATTARIVTKAGFDGVQIHGAHGYLVSQFLSPLSNRRTDRKSTRLNSSHRYISRMPSSA
jgi:2,4-dienoyl-CoA reductase-like NADH-dependent reductase (Old Yellow Enzyme family)